MKQTKKGFTIVELVIVIAVIAILAAVLIPTFSNIIQKANTSSDTQLVRNLNTALAEDTAFGNEHNTMQDALDAAEEAGYIVSKINAKASGNKILWDSVADCFCYLDGETGEVSYTPDVTAKKADNNVDLWTIASEPNATYSTYLYNATATEFSDVKTGLDVGNETVTSIKYVGNGKTQKVVIRTNAFDTKLTVEGFVDSADATKGDVVTHYGYAGLVTITKVAMASYDENGTVGRLNVVEGHVDVQAGATVYQIVASAGNDSAVSVEANATVYKNDGTLVASAITKSTTEFIDDCGTTCTHGETETLIDGHYMYEICKNCGYTVVTVINGSETVKVAAVDTNGEEKIVPVSTYTHSGSGENDTQNVVLKDGKVTLSNAAEPSTKTPEVDGTNFDVTCKHEHWSIAYNSDWTAEIHTCDNCGLSYSNDTTSWSDYTEAAVVDDNNKIVSIANAEQFAWFAKNVNSNDTIFTNYTIELTNDIDLGAHIWVSANINRKDTTGLTFDGKGHTVKNLIIIGKHDVGLFGQAACTSIKNLIVDNANVTGINRVAVIAGHGMCTLIDNCVVRNATITTSVEANDDGDKAGAICGYLSGEGTAWVKECTAENVTVTGYRDIGALVGIANGTATVTGNTITNCKVINDQSINYKNYTGTEFDANEVVGETNSNATVSDNIVTNVTVTFKKN